MGGSLTGDFQPSAACKTLDYPGGKSREINAEMQAKTPQMRFRHFRNTLYRHVYTIQAMSEVSVQIAEMLVREQPELLE